MAKLWLRQRQEAVRHSTKAKIFLLREASQETEQLAWWNSCAGSGSYSDRTTSTASTTTRTTTTMCSPPSWKSSEGEDIEADHSIWSSKEEDEDEADDGEESDWSPQGEGQ